MRKLSLLLGTLTLLGSVAANALICSGTIPLEGPPVWGDGHLWAVQIWAKDGNGTPIPVGSNQTIPREPDGKGNLPSLTINGFSCTPSTYLILVYSNQDPSLSLKAKQGEFYTHCFKDSVMPKMGDKMTFGKLGDTKHTSNQQFIYDGNKPSC